jgi:tRNA(Ile)-lysidine synthase
MRNKANLDRIALGHTRSDQAETVLYRFLRGSGTAGLAAMRPVTRDDLIRPMLWVSRDEVRQWALRQSITWREDSTNQDNGFVRNLLRNKAIPALTREVNPALESVLAGTALVAQAEEDYWGGIVSGIYPKIAERTQLGLFLQIPDLNGLHPAVRRRLVRHAVAQVRGDLRGVDVQHIEAILAVCDSKDGHDRVIIPGVDAFRSYRTLLLAEPKKWNEGKRHFRLEIEPCRSVELPFGLGRIRLDPTPKGLQTCANVRIDQTPSTEIAYLNSDALRGPIYIRNWEPGDGLRRLGHSSFEKLKSLFGEYKILLWERRHWPVLICGDDVIWTKRFGCSAEAAADPETQQVIRLEYSV